MNFNFQFYCWNNLLSCLVSDCSTARHWDGSYTDTQILQFDVLRAGGCAVTQKKIFNFIDYKVLTYALCLPRYSMVPNKYAAGLFFF